MAQKKMVNFVVTDLDDTLWDWLKMWHNSFSPYLKRIANDLSIDLEVLKRNFKKLHQKYHTTEASPFLEDLDGLTEDQIMQIRTAGDERRSIMHEYNSNKKNNLSLYPGVFETLTFIKSKGCKIVGYTESNSFFTKYRIRHLNLDGILESVYAPEDTGTPVNMQKAYVGDYWEPKKTQFKQLPKNFKKPNVEILNTILTDFNATRESTIYVGDKLDRDIYMAQQANITSVYAKYGHIIDSSNYELLRDVTHWTDEDVQREKEAKLNFHNNPKPDYILENSFSQLINLFEFKSFSDDR